MATVCPTPIKFCRVRVTRLDPITGAVLGGATGGAVSKGAVTIAFSPEIEEGEEATLKNGCGEILATAKEDDRFKRWSMVLTMGEFDPAVFSILTGATAATDGADLIGIIGEDQFADDFEPTLAALEGWAQAYEGDIPDSTRPWFYVLIPASSWVIGDFTLGADPATIPLNGFSKSNDMWGNGPYDDTGFADQVSTWAMVQVSEDPPDAACGYISVVAGS
jgi:hypothetical protein